jgi:hypothetical protein
MKFIGEEFIGEEFIGEDGRDSVTGDSETEAKLIEASFTVHFIFPLDAISTLPKIFNFDEGFIFVPDNTSKVTNGAWEFKSDSSITFSHLRLSAMLPNDDLPLITIWNISFVVTVEEWLTVTTTWEDEEDSGVKMRESQRGWYEGDTWKQLNSNNKPELVASFESRLESKLVDISNNTDPSVLNLRWESPTRRQIKSPEFTNTSTVLEDNFKVLECLTDNFTLYKAPTAKR